ncbi:retrotransposon protein, putative, ty3-gypsy subclass [Tanacetum coccineum]
MEKLFQVLGCPDNFKTRLAAFKLEGDALSWWKAHLRTQVGGDAFADTCTWVAFREIFYNRYFPASEQQRYEQPAQESVRLGILTSGQVQVLQGQRRCRIIPKEAEAEYASGFCLVLLYYRWVYATTRDQAAKTSGSSLLMREFKEQLQEMFGEWPLFRPVFAMVWMGEMACVLIYRELKYYASTFHNRCLFRDATICLTKLARGKYFSKIDLRLVSPASFMSLSLVILYLPDDIIIGSSRLKLSPMAGDLLGDGGEAFSGACWLYRRSGGFQYTSDASKERFWVVLLIANGNGPGDSICYVKLIDIFKIIRAQIYFYSAETKHETVKMVGTFRLDVELCVRGSGGYWASMRIESNLMLQIKEAQRDDGELWAIVQNVEDGKHTEFSVDDDSVVWFEDRLCVPNDQALREKVMTEAHSSPFTIHPGSTKMYRDLKQYFWWNGMKQDVATRWRFLWKWDEISMDLLLVVLLSEKDMMRFGWLSELSKCTNEKVAVAKEKLKEARSRQKSYADKHRRDLEFQVGDRVFLKVSPFRGVKRFGIKGKLSPRFIGPFEILERIERFRIVWRFIRSYRTFSMSLSYLF